MAVKHKILSTGSQGNAVVLNDAILIDCGVPFKKLRDVYRDLRLVLLTHIHADHFRASSIRKLAIERPSLRFGCGCWLVDDLVSCGVDKANIDVLEFDRTYTYGIADVTPVPLVHNVPNCGYKLHFPDGSKAIYATDTNNLNGIEAWHYDLYMIEANYEDEIMHQRIKDKRMSGDYAYEYEAAKNHLSKAKSDDFICQNAGPNSEFVYLHCHIDKY